MKHKDEISQLRSWTPKQINAKITDSRKKLVELRQDKILGKLKNLHEIGALRKTVARYQTILDEKITAELT